MAQQIFLSGFTREDFEESIVCKVTDRLLNKLATPANAVPAEDLLTRKQVAELLNVSLVTVSKWQKNGTLRFYRYGTRIRFKKNEILKAEKYMR